MCLIDFRYKGREKSKKEYKIYRYTSDERFIAGLGLNAKFL